MRYVRKHVCSPHLLIAIAFGSAIAACGSDDQAASIPSLPGPPPPLTSVLAEYDAAYFNAHRPGDREAAFAGDDLSPAELYDLEQKAIRAVDDCVAAKGISAAPRRPQSIPIFRVLAASDRASFRRTYGYGVVANIEAELKAANAAASARPQVLSAETEDAFNVCQTEGDKVLGANAPPPDLLRREAELLYQAGSSEEYSRASEAWVQCMRGSGIDLGTVSQPFHSSGIVLDHLYLKFGSDLKELKPGRADFRAQIDESQTVEKAVFKADAECLATSDAGRVMLQIEADIITQLMVEFPEYAPPSADPIGSLWSIGP